FGKTVAHNLALLRAVPRLARELALPLVVGLSRKSFLAHFYLARSASSGATPPTAPSEQKPFAPNEQKVAGFEAAPAERDPLGNVLHALISAHCALLRVHDVPSARAALALAAAMRENGHA